MGRQEIWLIIGAFAVILIICVSKKHLEWLLNLLLRGVLGTVAIFFINLAVTGHGYPMLVGVNPATVLTCSVLGFPGLAALYGIQILYLL